VWAVPMAYGTVKKATKIVVERVVKNARMLRNVSPTRTVFLKSVVPCPGSVYDHQPKKNCAATVWKMWAKKVIQIVGLFAASTAKNARINKHVRNTTIAKVCSVQHLGCVYLAPMVFKTDGNSVWMAADDVQKVATRALLVCTNPIAIQNVVKQLEQVVLRSNVWTATMDSSLATKCLPTLLAHVLLQKVGPNVFWTQIAKATNAWMKYVKIVSTTSKMVGRMTWTAGLVATKSVQSWKRVPNMNPALLDIVVVQLWLAKTCHPPNIAAMDNWTLIKGRPVWTLADLGAAI
jgi:hypothetical protein